MMRIARFVWSHPIAAKSKTRALARIAVWQIRSRLQTEIILPWIYGQHLVVRRGMTGATGNIYAGLHEFADMAFLLHFLRLGDLFFDIGANVGTYTVLASGVRRAKTWAFEPDPNIAAHLRRNVAINRLDELVTVHQLALGADEAEVPFTVGLDTVNRVAAGREGNVQLVRQMPLDRIAAARAPLMMKIDVEGYEPEVLKGAMTLLMGSSLKAVECETVTADMEQTLTSNGFERLFYNPFTRHLSARLNGPAASNALYIRDAPFVCCRLQSAESFQVLGVTF
jgi:FkbM family methyltransferase